jgi:protein tyrosine phosphatase (PTP) superfamily phosphohydrolase (DUF442 family)
LAAPKWFNFWSCFEQHLIFFFKIRSSLEFSWLLRDLAMNFPRLILSAVLLLNCTLLPALAAENSTAAEAAPAKAAKPVEDLPNLHEVHPFLYRSGEPTEAGFKKLKEMGVKTLIDLRAPSERHFDEEKAAKELGLKYIMLTMTSAPPTKKQVDTFLSTVKKAQKDPEKGSVLVHCAHGSDRTGCMVGIWRVTQENWNYDDTYKEMRKYWFTPKFTKLADAVRERVKAKSDTETPTESSAH